MTKKQIEESEKRITELQNSLVATAGIIQFEGGNINNISANTINENLQLLDNSEEYRQKAIENLNGYLRGLTDEEKRKFLEEAGIENADLVINKLNKEELAEEEGLKILQGYYRGLSNTQMRANISKAASSISVEFQSNMDKKMALGTNGSHANGLSYVPFNGYIAELHKGERVLTAKENEAYSKNFGVQGILNSKVNKDIINNQTTNNKNIVVQFYPQTMTEAEMERAFNYVDRRYGQYMP